MMRLSAMWAVDRTIDGEGGSRVAERVLAPWAHDAGTLRFVRSSANHLYVFERDGVPHLLRFVGEGERAREVVEADAALVGWLAGTGVDVATPVPSDAGRAVETVETEVGTLHATVSVAVEGEERELEALGLDGFRAWGAVAGRLHAALDGCPAEIARRRPMLREGLETMLGLIPAGAGAVREEGAAIAAALDSLQGGGDGLVHLDLELDNLVWGDDGRVTVLDFDDCAHAPREAEVAFALRDLFDEGVGMEDERVAAFVAGYREHRRLDDGALARAGLFSRMARLRTYAAITRALDLDLEPGPEHAEWLHGLVGRLRERMEAYEGSLGRG